jgi:uncharacterized SAM-binding protein YcdF (DUF218 family)
MVLKSILENVGLPPMLFVFLTILGLVIGARNRRSGHALAWVSLVGLVALSLPVVSGALLAGLERDLPLVPPPNAMPEAIVILGGDLLRTSDAPFARPGYLTLDRLRTAVMLHARTGLPMLVTGGTVQRGRPSVATFMADSLRTDFQAPATWVEPASADTWQNAAFSAEILKAAGVKSVYVVTDGWHMRRALLAFSKTGLTVTAAPTSINVFSGILATDFVPRISAWQFSYFAVHEWIGYAWYAIR